MILACQYCGGLEAFIIAGAIAAWGWGCYMLIRAVNIVRTLKPQKKP